MEPRVLEIGGIPLLAPSKALSSSIGAAYVNQDDFVASRREPPW
jgi:hypothetical protein